MRCYSVLITLFAVWAGVSQAESNKAFDFQPPANTPESAILRHYRKTGIDADIRLSFISARLLQSLRAAGQSASPSRFHISKADWPHVLRALAQGPVEDIDAGAWVVEYPAQIGNLAIAQMVVVGQKQLGTRLFRRFVAAHELGHSTLRRLTSSGRLIQELPNAIPVLHADDVFKESFSDMLAIGVLQDIYHQPVAKMARSIALFRHLTVAIEPEEAEHMEEVADLLNAYAGFVDTAGPPPPGIDAQISHVLKFLAESGVFASMLVGPEAWQRIRDEGCFGCFQRVPVRYRGPLLEN